MTCTLNADAPKTEQLDSPVLPQADSSALRRSRILLRVLSACALGVALVYAYCFIFSRSMSMDEGYLMITGGSVQSGQRALRRRVPSVDAFEQHGTGTIHTRAAGKNPRIVAEGEPAKDRRGRTVDAKLAFACYGSDSAIDSLRDRRLSPDQAHRTIHRLRAEIAQGLQRG